MHHDWGKCLERIRLPARRGVPGASFRERRFSGTGIALGQNRHSFRMARQLTAIPWARIAYAWSCRCYRYTRSATT